MNVIFLECVNDSLKTHFFKTVWEFVAERFEKYCVLVRDSNKIKIHT